MLDIERIRENPNQFKQGIEAKKGNPNLIDQCLELDKKRRALLKEVEDLRARKKQISNKQNQLEEAKKIKGFIKEKEPVLNLIEEELKKVLYQIPNLPAANVPIGKDESGNMVIKSWGTPPQFNFQPKDHLELGELLNLMDVKRASKVSGTRFGYLKNEAVLLEFALASFALEKLIKEGFIPMIPPVLIKKGITEGLGYWQEGGHENYYWVLEPEEETKGFYLVGTAEHAIVPIHKDEILESSELPKRYVAFSSCFRREAGSYGKDTRGILRVHQFDKVEMVSFVKPEEDDREHKFLLSLQENLLQALKIPYRVVNLCSGDLSAPTASAYDLEAWLPGQNRYREVTSCSTTTDFQARRLNIKYRRSGETAFVHILNGTAFAIGRTIIAILENYQREDGSVVVPEALRNHVGKEVIEPRR